MHLPLFCDPGRVEDLFQKCFSFHMVSLCSPVGMEPILSPAAHTHIPLPTPHYDRTLGFLLFCGLSKVGETLFVMHSVLHQMCQAHIRLYFRGTFLEVILQRQAPWNRPCVVMVICLNLNPDFLLSKF